MFDIIVAIIIFLIIVCGCYNKYKCREDKEFINGVGLFLSVLLIIMIQVLLFSTGIIK